MQIHRYPSFVIGSLEINFMNTYIYAKSQMSNDISENKN